MFVCRHCFIPIYRSKISHWKRILPLSPYLFSKLRIIFFRVPTAKLLEKDKFTTHVFQTYRIFLESLHFLCVCIYAQKMKRLKMKLEIGTICTSNMATWVQSTADTSKLYIVIYRTNKRKHVPAQKPRFLNNTNDSPVQHNAPPKLVQASVLTLWEDSIISNVVAILENNHASSTAHIFNAFKKITALVHKHQTFKFNALGTFYLRQRVFCGAQWKKSLMRAERLTRTGRTHCVHAGHASTPHQCSRFTHAPPNDSPRANRLSDWSLRIQTSE